MTTTLPITTSGPLAPDYVAPSQTAPEQAKPAELKPRGRMIMEVEWDYERDSLVVRGSLDDLHMTRTVRREDLENGLEWTLGYMAQQLTNSFTIKWGP